MIISVNWLKKFTDIDLPVDELATLIGARLVEIEKVIDLGAKYQDVVVARVVECDKHEGSDRLNVTKLDDGGKIENVQRDESGYVQVVCGAPNVRKGLTVAWLPPGATVPETYGTSEPFVLGTRNLRGIVSNGMIASPRELALRDDHDGIMELDDLEPGTSFAKAYELDDYLLDIENKSLTHRPDCFGIIGFAREVAAIQGKAFQTPDWLMATLDATYDQDSGIKAPTVTIDDPALSDRYQAIVLTGAKESATSPLLIQTYLSRIGVRPINAIVDVTNYLMMLTGQPLHAFDYDKLMAVGGGVDIHVRAGRVNEKLALLDGREITLTPDDIVIAAGEKAVALAGAMGGAETEIDGNTKTIILESATFNLYNLRATQMRHGIFSEAITRFTKGQPAELTEPVLHEAVRLLGRNADAKAVTSAIDAYPGKHDIQTISIPAKMVNAVLGRNLTVEDMMETLQHVEFDVTKTDDDADRDPKADGILHVKPPYWRSDIHIPEDIIEEIGRIDGFDSIDPVLPMRDFTAVRPSTFDALRTKIRQTLTRAGANEVLTYSFVHGDMLKRAEQRPEESYRITNSISPNLQYYRQSLTPSLLGLVHPNIKQGFDDFALYELNKVHPKSHGLTDEGVPHEVDMLALTVAGKHPHQGAPYYQAKKLLDNLAQSLGLELAYLPIQTDPNYPETAPFEFRRSAMVTDLASGATLGIVGEYKKSVVRGFKLPDYCAGFEISTRALEKAMQQSTSEYTPLSRYPGTERDVCFQVGSDVTYSDIVAAVGAALDEIDMETTVSPVDIYQADGAITKNITVRIELTSHVKTLTSEDVTPVIDAVIAAAKTRTGATVL